MKMHQEGSVKKPTVALFVLMFSLFYLFYSRFSEQYNDPRVLRRKNLMKTLNELSAQIPFDKIHNDPDFVEFSMKLKSMEKPAYLILYDSSNVNVVLNHVCNLDFHPNSTSRLVAVSFDREAQVAVQNVHPNIPNVLINLEPLVKSLPIGTENRPYLIYTIALLAHAKICASLALRGIDFWSMHQDTLWIQNFSELGVEDSFPDAHMVFDTIGNEEQFYDRWRKWVCGATFFVRGSPLTYQFFMQLTSFMLHHQSPDSSIMTYLCGHSKYKCDFLPHNTSSSWNYFEGPRKMVPALIQLDGGKRPGETKMDVLRRGNFIFRHETNGTCNEDALRNISLNARQKYGSVRRKDPFLHEDIYQRTYYRLKNMFNIDPKNAKYFLTFHRRLI